MRPVTGRGDGTLGRHPLAAAAGTRPPPVVDGFRAKDLAGRGRDGTLQLPSGDGVYMDPKPTAARSRAKRSMGTSA